MTSDRTHIPKGDILVVDDRVDNVRLLSGMLSERGYKVRKIIKGELTFEVVQVNPPDLILLDIKMPNISGFDVCQQLKANENTRHIPVIFLSASDESIDKVKAFSVGGEDYITKPFEIQEMVVRIEHQLKLLRLRRELQFKNKALQTEINEKQKAEIALQHMNEELEKRVQQRTAELLYSNQQLEVLKQKLELALEREQELSQLKSAIITTISHEYRTPMSVISSSAGMLKDYSDRLTEDLSNKHIGRIQQSINRMTLI